MFSCSTTYQYLATLSVNLISIAYGTSAGWPSSSFLILQSDNLSPLSDGSLSVEQLSWVGSLLCIGGLVGTLVFGWMADVVGRKNSLCILAFPQILSWLLIVFATNGTYLYVSRFCSGLACGGAFVLVPLFVAEISEDRIRGTLGSLLMVTANAGILLAFIAGHLLSFQNVAILFVFIPTIFLLLFVLYPETPYYLIKNGKTQLAEKSLQLYRNVKSKDKLESAEFQAEFSKIKCYLQNKDNSLLHSKLCLQDFTSRAPRKAICIGLALIFLHEFCGCFTMINYTATIFAESGSNISPNLSAIIVGLIQLIGTFVSTRLVDKAGRKFLLLLSSIGSGVSLTFLGIYTYLNFLGYPVQSYSWVSIVSFSSMLFLASCGIIPLPFVVISEIMPDKIRSIGATICLCISWILAFIMVKCFSTVVALIGMHGCIFMFAICCFCGAAFAIFVMPETKGKSYDEILNMLKQ